jgi:hypothetical protein
MKTNSPSPIPEAHVVLLILAALVALTGCGSVDQDSGDTAYQRRQSAQDFLRDREQREFLADFNPNFATPVAGYGVGTGGSGWFVNEGAAYNGLYQLQSR